MCKFSNWNNLTFVIQLFKVNFSDMKTLKLFILRLTAIVFYKITYCAGKYENYVTYFQNYITR